MPQWRCCSFWSPSWPATSRPVAPCASTPSLPCATNDSLAGHGRITGKPELIYLDEERSFRRKMRGTREKLGLVPAGGQGFDEGGEREDLDVSGAAGPVVAPTHNYIAAG